LNAVHHSERYQLSFTSGALHLRGAAIAADLYRESGDWGLVRAALRSDNLLQARTDATSARSARELTQRLETLSDDEIALLADATGDELRQLMWAATARRYELVGEFAEEVLRERFLLMQPELLPAHFDAFVSGKMLWHDEVAELRDSTYRKLRSNLFAMLREAGLLTEEGIIIPTVLSARVRDLLVQRDPTDIRFFPTREAA
jgi:hypothetical protein